MLFRDVVELISITNTQNNIGDLVEVKSERQVFADRKSIGQTEFYQAAASGLKPEVKFVVRAIEYQGERKLSFCGREYDIIRTYDKDMEFTELICSGLVR